MGVFTKRPTSNDCIERISNAMNEAMAIRELLDATPKGKEYKADWNANRKYAQRHLMEAWDSLAGLFNAVVLPSLSPPCNT